MYFRHQWVLARRRIPSKVRRRHTRVQLLHRHHRRPHQSIDGMAIWSKENHMRLNTIKTQHMVISKKQQSSQQQLTANPQWHRPQVPRIRDSKGHLFYEKYEYLGVVLNNSLNYDARWDVTSSQTNPHIYLLNGFHGRQACVHLQKLDPEPVHLRRTLVSIGINKSKKEQRHFLNVISTELHIHREISACTQHQAHGGFSEWKMRQHCTKYPQRPEPSHHDHRNKYNNNKIVPRTNTTQYQNSVLQKSLRIIRDGHVNKYKNPRRIETTTAAYHVEIQALLHKTRPKTKQLTSSTQCPLCVHKAKNINDLKIHNSKKHKLSQITCFIYVATIYFHPTISFILFI